MYQHMGCATPYAVIAGRGPMVRMGEDPPAQSMTDKASAWLESSSLVQHVSPTSTVKNKTVTGVVLALGAAWYLHKKRVF